jgi:hypothetical protein
MGVTEKVLEQQLRQRLARMGYLLVKSRARDPHHVTFGHYMIVHAVNAQVTAGQGFTLELGDVADWIIETSTDGA